MTAPMRPERRAAVASAALARNDRLAQWIKYAVVALLIYIGVMVTVASVYGVTSASQSVGHAKAGERHAQNAEKFARLALRQSRTNTGIASDVRSLVAQQAPCMPGDPPDTPACKRDAASAERLRGAINAVNEAIAAGIAAHDLNAHKEHEVLRSRLGIQNRLPARTPIPTVRQADQPATTTTTAPCPKLPNGKCRP